MKSTDMTAHRAAQIVAVALISTVVLQVLYMAMLGGPQPSDPAQGTTQADVAAYFTERWSEVATIWTLEAIAFAAIALGAFVAAVQGGGSRIAWAAIALAGIFNLVQIGIGLSLFKPIALGDDAQYALFGTVVGAAFFFYFLAKALLGFAALVLGALLLRTSSGMAAKTVAGITALSGLAALVCNIAGMGQGMAWVLQAGATGTLAALFVAIAGLMAAKRSET